MDTRTSVAKTTPTSVWPKPAPRQWRRFLRKARILIWAEDEEQTFVAGRYPSQ
ncbi:hypothetical protein HCH_02974 [Hahella chejuensis KCTC 2396]|uniref:Uncharacterized protein n=1 Tax=Hahella chejuensis (strain KCTC 2396) TaxID=349521 RepID=Q2SHY1_HAHCH|nr:hypothetical protein HCH_02974 [Hahella chejuensis KCTC 2396]